MAGWWLVAALVITSAFKSSLVAHLSVQGMTSPVDSFEDLLVKGDWRWGMERKMLTGAPLHYFQKTADPDVKEIYRRLEARRSWVRGCLNMRRKRMKKLCYSVVLLCFPICLVHRFSLSISSPFSLPFWNIWNLDCYFLDCR